MAQVCALKQIYPLAQCSLEWFPIKSSTDTNQLQEEQFVLHLQPYFSPTGRAALHACNRSFPLCRVPPVRLFPCTHLIQRPLAHKSPLGAAGCYDPIQQSRNDSFVRWDFFLSKGRNLPPVQALRAPRHDLPEPPSWY